MKDEGYTGVVAAEVLHIVKCTRVEVHIRKTNECYEQLPVSYNNETLFLSPRTRILVGNGKQITCEGRMPSMFKIGEQWYRSLPDIIDAPQPEILAPREMPKWKYVSPESLAIGGIYSERDTRKLRDLIVFPLEKGAVLNKILRGATGQQEGTIIPSQSRSTTSSSKEESSSSKAITADLGEEGPSSESIAPRVETEDPASSSIEERVETEESSSRTTTSRAGTGGSSSRVTTPNAGEASPTSRAMTSRAGARGSSVKPTTTGAIGGGSSSTRAPKAPRNVRASCLTASSKARAWDGSEGDEHPGCPHHRHDGSRCQAALGQGPLAPPPAGYSSSHNIIKANFTSSTRSQLSRAIKSNCVARYRSAWTRARYIDIDI
ncbi:unnamed protein product [Trichogramma brassicae]|uniref:Uncharacterized protein n=1 Tax=Trichogramma brassicae TaxID=86971 RepID=A0A6H5I8B8_9HYME|nr:unnamed protein product [Trichogramma brassicae]